MIVKLNREQVDWLQDNCFFEELNPKEQSELDDSIPNSMPTPNSSDDRVEWQCPAFASILVRNRFAQLYDEQSRLLGEMNAGIVNGTLQVTILGTKVN